MTLNASPMTLPELVRRRSTMTPDRAALVLDGERTLTFAEWDRRAAAVAVRLIELGLGAGDRVAVFPGADAWIELAVATLAIYLASGVVVTIPPGLPPAQARRRLDHCGTTGAVFAGGTAPDWPWRWTASSRQLGTVSGRPPAGLACPDGLAEILHTSGTTGRPKAVAVSHASLAYGAHVPPASASGPEPPTRTLCPVRIGTNAGHRALTMAMSSLSTIHVMTQEEPERIAAEVARLGIGTVVLPPVAFGSWPATRVYERHDLSSLTTLVLGSSSVPTATVGRLSPSIPRAQIIVGYGATEAAPASLSLRIPPWEEHQDPAVLAGHETVPLGVPVSGTEVMIAGPDGEPLPPGQIGEICLRSPAPRRFYYGDPETTARTFRPDGWTRLGDLGYQDEHGHAHFFDRSSHVLNRQGRRLSSSRLENALYWHDDVIEAAVVAAPGDLLTAAAVTVAGSRVDGDHLLRFLAERLPSQDLPDRVQLLRELPRDGLGKIAKRRVLDQLVAERPA